MTHAAVMFTVKKHSKWSNERNYLAIRKYTSFATITLAATGFLLCLPLRLGVGGRGDTNS